MRTIETTVFNFEELSEKARQKVLSDCQHGDLFYDMNMDDYHASMEVLEHETNNNTVSFDRKKIYWGSSQGWYYDRRITLKSFLNVRFYYEKDGVTIDIDYIDSDRPYTKFYNEFCVTGFINSVDCDYSSSIAFSYCNQEINSYGVELTIKQEQTIKKVCMDILEEAYQLLLKIEDIIQKTADYYPTDEEIIEFINANGIEFYEDGSIYNEN